MTWSKDRFLWNRGLAIAKEHADDLSGSGIFASSGIVCRDDGSATIAGITGSGTMSEPLSAWCHFTCLVCGESSANFTTGSSFGSFSLARTDLHGLIGAAVWTMWNVIQKPMTPEDFADLLSGQAPIAFHRSLYDNKWKAHVYQQTPDSDRYFLHPDGSTNYKWLVGEDFEADSVVVSFTPVEGVINEIHVKFCYASHAGIFTRDAFISPSRSDDGTGTRDQNTTSPNDRESDAADSKNDYGIKASRDIECPGYAEPDTYTQAYTYRNYVFDRYRRPRMVVKFTTGPRAIGLEPGMVTLIDNTLQDYIPCPWYPGPGGTARDWDDMKFFVRDLDFDYSDGNFRHTVTLEEIA